MASLDPIYNVLKKNKEFELRIYKKKLIASVEIDFNYKTSVSVGFRKLADFIFGNNQKKIKIEMTAPVEQYAHGLGWTVVFNLPNNLKAEDIPKPLNSEIRISEIPETKYGVKIFSGLVTERKIERLVDELTKCLISNGYKILGKPIIARYDPPWILPFFRRNEILIEIE